MTHSPYSIATAGGASFDFAAPGPEMIDLETIAWHLAREPRWCGNLKWHFSVAQHSLCVAEAIENPSWRIYGLLHDAAEAYTRDLPTPFKQWLVMNGTDFYALERRILKAVWQKFDIVPPTKEISEAVDLADARQLATEARDVVKSPPIGWEAWAKPFPDRLRKMGGEADVRFGIKFAWYMHNAQKAGLAQGMAT